ncbi:MAG: prepilin-type N-terminal cleavage/methylation domain-containing protein [Acidobacteriota bacterium]
MTRKNLPSRGPSEHRRGVTFLEMLIAITILAIVIVAILQLFDKDVAVRKQQDQMAELQQNLRASMDLIARDMRSANPCATFMGLYNKPNASPPISSPVRVTLPISLAWMTNGAASPTAFPSTQALTIPSDSRPDGVGVMRCVTTGIVDVDPVCYPSLPGGPIKLKQGLGIQPTDLPTANGASRFLLVWSDNPKASDPAVMPCFFTAEIQNVQGGFQNNINAETVIVGGPITPTNDNFSTFGQHFLNGAISNYTGPGCQSQSAWKAAMVEWVEYMVDKWENNTIPHSYSNGQAREGSPEHPLLCRRVNPHVGVNGLVPDYDVIGQDIENLQIVWMFDTDNDPATVANMPGFGVEFQAGDPTVSGAFPNAVQNGISVLTKGLAPGTQVWKTTFAAIDPKNPVILRKARVTLLARGREADLSMMQASGTSPMMGFPAIEMTPGFYQGSAAVPKSTVAPYYLGAYRRRTLTQEVTLRNYIPAALN